MLKPSPANDHVCFLRDPSMIVEVHEICREPFCLLSLPKSSCIEDFTHTSLFTQLPSKEVLDYSICQKQQTSMIWREHTVVRSLSLSVCELNSLVCCNSSLMYSITWSNAAMRVIYLETSSSDRDRRQQRLMVIDWWKSGRNRNP